MNLLLFRKNKRATAAIKIKMTRIATPVEEEGVGSNQGVIGITVIWCKKLQVLLVFEMLTSFDQGEVWLLSRGRGF